MKSEVAFEDMRVEVSNSHAFRAPEIRKTVVIPLSVGILHSLWKFSFLLQDWDDLTFLLSVKQIMKLLRFLDACCYGLCCSVDVMFLGFFWGILHLISSFYIPDAYWLFHAVKWTCGLDLGEWYMSPFNKRCVRKLCVVRGHQSWKRKVTTSPGASWSFLNVNNDGGGMTQKYPLRGKFKVQFLYYTVLQQYGWSRELML